MKLFQREKEDTEAQVGRPCERVTMIRVMQPQTKELVGPPEAGRGKEGFYSKVFLGNMALLTS